MFRSGYIAIVGLPNVGKSTFLNQVLGEKVAIVTPKPQTTRHRILGILHRPEAQLVFLDTPGIHTSKKLLNEKIVEVALATLADADVVLHMVEPIERDPALDAKIQKLAREKGKTYAVLINKVDQINKESLLPRIAAIQENYQPDAIIPISALKGESCKDVVRWLEQHLPEGPPYFPEDMYTDHSQRFLCEETIREKAMKFLHQEIPYGMAAQVETFTEEKKLVKIQAALIVARDSHKGMVIGAGGKMIKKIGKLAREDLEAALGKKVYLELFVKVVEGWTERESRLKEFGIQPPEN